MSEKHKRFDFDEFDHLIGEVLDEPVEEQPVAEVIDLNANVVELRPEPPDEAA